MARPRQSRRDLPPRVYVKHGAYYFVYPSGKWQRLASVGSENEMRVAWAYLEQPNHSFGKVAALIDDYLTNYAAKEKAPRTFKDNLKEAEYLKAFFGEMRPQDIQARHVGAYLEENRQFRAVRANREKSLLSHVFTWAMRHPVWGCAVLSNPCKGVVRNHESKRIRIVEDEEYLAVYELASINVQRVMTLIYRTLQRPSDILKLGTKNIIQRSIDGNLVDVLKIKQSKTNQIVEIILSDEIKSVLLLNQPSTAMDANQQHQTQYFILNRDGQPYTVDGINSNFAKALNKYRTFVEKNTGVKPIPFGLYDLKGKGATDMYQNNVPLEHIQALAGHQSVRTTEIYIKAMLNKPVVSNTRKIG